MRRVGGWVVLVAIAVAVVAAGCASDGGDDASLKGLLLEAADLGSDFEPEPYEPAARPGICRDELTSASSVGAAAVSNARQQRVTQELTAYSSADEASEAFEGAARSSNCGAEGNLANGRSLVEIVDIPGADEAFAVELFDGNDSVGFVVARVDHVIATFTVQIHNGASTIDVLGSLDVAAIGVGLLTTSR